MVRTSAPASSRWVAKQFRKVWGLMAFLNQSCALGSLLAGIPDHLAIDGCIRATPAPVGKQPGAWFSLQAAPVGKS